MSQIVWVEAATSLVERLENVAFLFTAKHVGEEKRVFPTEQIVIKVRRSSR